MTAEGAVVLPPRAIDAGTATSANAATATTTLAAARLSPNSVPPVGFRRRRTLRAVGTNWEGWRLLFCVCHRG